MGRGGPPSEGHRSRDHAVESDPWSHELRTPIHGILGGTELLLDGSVGPLSGDARACVGEIRAAGHNLLVRVQVLLSWLEVKRRTPDPSLLPLDLLDLLRQVSAEEFGHVIRIRPDDACLSVRGDRAWLRAMLVHLVGLGGDPARAAAPLVTLTRDDRSRHTALGFAQPGFCPDRVDRAHLALIEAVCRLHGMLLGWTCDGPCLYWPSAATEVPCRGSDPGAADDSKLVEGGQSSRR